MLQLTILDVIVSLLDIFFLIALLLLIDHYTRNSPISNNRLLTTLLNKEPLLLIGGFSILFALKNWFAFSVSKKQFYFIYNVSARISEKKLSNYLDGAFSNFINIDSSIHYRSIYNNPLEFSIYILRGIQQITSQSILILLAVIPIIIFKPFLFSLLLLMLLPPVFLLSFILKKRLQRIRNTTKTIHSKLMQHLKEAVAGYIESNIYHKQDFFLNRFTHYLSLQSRNLAEQQIIQTFPPRLIEVFAVFGLFFLIVINFFTKSQTLDLITIGAFMAAAYKIIPGIVKILNSLGQIKTYDFTVQSLLHNNMDTVEAMTDKDEHIESVTFSNITFNYNGKTVLHNFNLEIKRNDFIGISGKSGQGKTTAMNLLLGFLKPRSGSIEINGEAKDSSAIHGYWKNISYVQQETFLINDTILHNIVLQESDYDKDRLNEVIKLTGLQQLIGSSPDDLNRPIMEEGKNISGGQRQRIALARAFYKNADLIILDEPFNELDKESENCIIKYLKQLTQAGKMVILITHDKESLSACNKIISLDEK